MQVDAIGTPPSLRARSCASTYIVLGSFAGILLVCGFAAFLRTHDRNIVLVPLLATALLFSWISAFKIEVVNDVLTYRTLFGGRRSIALSLIKTAETDIGSFAALGPFYRLMLYPSDGSRPIAINMKVFSRQDLHRVFEILGPKLTKKKMSVFERN